MAFKKHLPDIELIDSRGSRKKSSLWVHLYCFTAAQMEKRVRELRCGLTDEAMRLLRKCKKKKAKLKLKRLTDSDEGRGLVETVKQRYEEEHRQFLEEEKKKEEAEKARRKPVDRVNKMVTERGCSTRGDDAIIDELLKVTSLKFECFHDVLFIRMTQATQ